MRPEARRHAAEWPQLTWDHVRKAMNKFPAKTAVGVDGWSPKQLAQLPEAAGQALTIHLIALERSAVIPAAQTEAWIVLLDKPDGGDRPIALLPFLYRVLLRCRRREVDKRNATHASEWDATAKGRGAEQAAVDDELEIEAAVAEGQEVAGALIDMKKY